MKHIEHDLHQGSLGDPQVYALASTLGRIVVTANGRHFRTLVRPGKAGVIDVPAGWSPERIDRTLVALLKQNGPKYFAGTFRTLSSAEE